MEKKRIKPLEDVTIMGHRFEKNKPCTVGVEVARVLLRYKLAEEIGSGSTRNTRAGEGVSRAK